MKHQTHRISVHKLAISLFLCCIAGSAMGIVFHPAREPNLTTWTDRPDSNTVGRWGSNGSCVVIAPNYVITTKHQGGGLATLIVIGDVTYAIDQIWPHPTADFRVVKLHSANLTTYVDMYTKNENAKSIIIGGFGKRREPADTTNPYAWTTESSNTNNPLLFGTNRVDSIDTIPPTEVIIADFDFLGTLFECTIAEFDSGGGWFIKDTDGKWKVAGLSRGVSDLGGFSSFSPPDNYLDAVRVSTYAPWVASLSLTTCSQPVPGDFDGNCIVDYFDLIEFTSHWLAGDCFAGNNYCQGSDFDRDGSVDMLDYSRLLENWMRDYLQ